MSIFRYIFLVFSYYFLVLNAHSQPKQIVKNMRMSAERYYTNGEYHAALSYYKRIDGIKPHDPETLFRIGECLFNLNEKTSSLDYFKKVQAIHHHKEEYLDYYLGRCYHLNHKLDSAIQFFTKFKQKITQHKLTKYPTSLINKYITMCTTGKRLMKDSLIVEIKNLGAVINTKAPEYAPVLTADEEILIFTSRRATTTGGKRASDKHFFEDIYIAKKENNQWSSVSNMGTIINSNEHDASIALSADGNQLFMYRSGTNNQSGDILESHRDTVWSIPKSVGDSINTTYWEPSCSISFDGKIMFFTSDKPGGLGGKDIYWSRKNNKGEWGKAKNAGTVINTNLDEDAPFIHYDGHTLYFSSKGHYNMGGYDIFTSNFNDSLEQFSEPKNIGYPINTASDDIFFVWSVDGRRGYFSSHRPDSYGDKDIYMVTREAPTPVLTLLKGKIYSKDSHAAVESEIIIYDLSTGALIGKYKSNSEGNFSAILKSGKQYAVHIHSAGHLMLSENIITEDEFSEVKLDFKLEKKVPGKRLLMKNVFFAENDTIIKQESIPELNHISHFLKSDTSTFAEVAGHSSQVGLSIEQRKTLSSRRASAVRNYLISKGVSESHLIAFGYGEDFVIEDSSEISTHNQQRIELILKEKSKFKERFYRGNALAVLLEEYLLSNELDTTFEMQYSDSLKKLALDYINNQIIYFDLGKYTLNDSGAIKLKQIAKILNKFNSFKISLKGYTDSKSSFTFNRRLSNRRVQATVKFLQKEGVSKKRCKIKGWGELRPRYSNDTEIGRQRNRRVEVFSYDKLKK